MELRKENRRRSLFDFESENSGIESYQSKLERDSKYPPEYVQKIKNELEQWEHCIQEIRNKPKEFKKETKELRKRKYDERILSTEQRDFLGSVNFSKYITRGNKFLTKVCILTETSNKDFDEEIRFRLQIVHNKISEYVFKCN